MTVIVRNPAPRAPAPRRPRDGASHCRSTLFLSWTPARTPDRRDPRRTGRYQARNGGRRGAPERRTPRTAVRARRCHRGRSRLPEPAAGVRRRRIAEPGAAFRFPAAWASCAHLPAIPCLRRRASAGIPFRSQVGTRPPGASWILQWRPLETFIRPRKPPRIARPQPGEDREEVVARLGEWREDGCLRRRRSASRRAVRSFPPGSSGRNSDRPPAAPAAPAPA